MNIAQRNFDSRKHSVALSNLMIMI